jgi:hypothetical protein
MQNSRSVLGFSIMTIVPLLQLGTEFLGTGDHGRALSKLAVTVVGVPLLLWGSSRALRWAERSRLGPVLLLGGGMLAAGTLYGRPSRSPPCGRGGANGPPPPRCASASPWA